jgi:hypothetical protein
VFSIISCSPIMYLWRMTQEKLINTQIKGGKWRWIGHTLMKPDHGVIEKRVLDWNPQSSRRSGHLKKTWQRTVEKEALFAGKRSKEVKSVTKKSN